MIFMIGSFKIGKKERGFMPDLKPLERQICTLQQFTLKKELTVDFLFELFERLVSWQTANW